MLPKNKELKQQGSGHLTCVNYTNLASRETWCADGQPPSVYAGSASNNQTFSSLPETQKHGIYGSKDALPNTRLKKKKGIANPAFPKGPSSPKTKARKFSEKIRTTAKGDYFVFLFSFNLGAFRLQWPRLA